MEIEQSMGLFPLPQPGLNAKFLVNLFSKHLLLVDNRRSVVNALVVIGIDSLLQS